MTKVISIQQELFYKHSTIPMDEEVRNIFSQFAFAVAIQKKKHSSFPAVEMEIAYGYGYALNAPRLSSMANHARPNKQCKQTIIITSQA